MVASDDSLGVRLAAGLLAGWMAACAGPPAAAEGERPSARGDEEPVGLEERPSARGDEESVGPEEASGGAAHGPWTVELTVDSAPFSEPAIPSVLVHAPPGFDPTRSLRIVVFLHGWNGCARVLLLAGTVTCAKGTGQPSEGWALAERIDASGTDALFLVPQLALLRRSGDPGRFVDAGRFRAFVEEVLAALEILRDAPIGPDGATGSRIERVTLLAHSAGFETALAILARGGLEISDVVLFDALYRGVEPFVDWVSAGPARRLLSFHTGRGRTAQQSRRLVARARAELGPESVGVDQGGGLSDLIADHRVVVVHTGVSHRDVPARHIPEVLEAIGLSAGR